jgi:uncharacterized membrane protein YjjP (DUF1212 family)
MQLLAMNLDGLFDGLPAMLMALAASPLALIFLIKTLLSRHSLVLVFINIFLSLLWGAPLVFVYLNDSQRWLTPGEADELSLLYFILLVGLTYGLHLIKRNIKASKN